MWAVRGVQPLGRTLLMMRRASNSSWLGYSATPNCCGPASFPGLFNSCDWRNNEEHEFVVPRDVGTHFRLVAYPEGCWSIKQLCCLDVVGDTLTDFFPTGAIDKLDCRTVDGVYESVSIWLVHASRVVNDPDSVLEGFIVVGQGLGKSCDRCWMRWRWIQSRCLKAVVHDRTNSPLVKPCSMSLLICSSLISLLLVLFCGRE